MLKILVSNDDGVLAPGLTALVNALKEIAEVFVVAPDRDRSGASNSLTLTNPLRVRHLDNGYWSVEGTPTDCVHLAITGLLAETPDLVVAGINLGSNLGDDVIYSGTVAAATEGRFLGLPSLAISLIGHEEKNYKTAGQIAKNLVSQLAESPIPAKTILNVNIPDVPFEELKGMEVTRLGARHSAAQTVQQTDPRGQTIYWIGPPGPEQDAGEGTDFYAINAGKVSITPLCLDLTHYDGFDQVTNLVTEINK